MRVLTVEECNMVSGGSVMESCMEETAMPWQVTLQVGIASFIPVVGPAIGVATLAYEVMRTGGCLARASRSRYQSS